MKDVYYAKIFEIHEVLLLVNLMMYPLAGNQPEVIQLLIPLDYFII